MRFSRTAAQRQLHRATSAARQSPLRLRNPPLEAETHRSKFPLVTNRELDDGAAGTGTFVYWPAVFITLPAPFIPFSSSSLCRRLLSTASRRCPCALYVVRPQREFSHVQARRHVWIISGETKMRMHKLLGIMSFIKPFAIVLSAFVCIVAMEMPAIAQQVPAATAAPEAPLQEIIVTGSRIAAPNEVSTSPIEVLSSKYIEATGKTDITDLINQLPQVFNNSIGQDLGNTTSGLTTAGGIATADLRGLGPNRTLVLVDGRRLGQGSPYTFIQSPAPDLDQIPAGLVDRIEVVTGGASAAYGSDAIAGVINFIMKRNFQGGRVDGQYDENLHDNNDGFVQGLVRQFNNSVPPTGTIQDGRQRNFDVMMGTNFADGKGNITAFLSYRHADPVASSQRDFAGCQLNPVFDAAGVNVTGTVCGGSSNSNFFHPTSGPNSGNVYSGF